ncbi:MAG: 1-acyl-sn-glycerol-3-phosphate acyltransferase [Planctomycetales bacterium]|nr:1-acyl-sn-glycerol-3-phosphate acyltransferase [Planctomycetales bacterium]
MDRSPAQPCVYSLLRTFSRLLGVTFYRLRCEGREHWPETGGGLVCSNHQSFFDPNLIGMTCPRQMNYLARDTLFKIPVLREVMTFLDAIPIDREGSGLSGLKETMKRLRAGELVLIFPEGTRTHDGDLRPLKPGFCSLARRSRVPLIPVGMDGAYQAWPRTSLFPLPGKLAVVIGHPISAEEIAEMSDEVLIAELESRMRACHLEAQRIREGCFVDPLLLEGLK